MTRIESLTLNNVKQANKINNDFIGRGKSCCICLPYLCCPLSESEFATPYQKHPELLELTGIALNDNDDIIGIARMEVYGQPQYYGCFGACLHTLKPNEAYIETLAVAANARGQGAGTKMLEWCEENAKKRGADILTLAVVNGNPARRLYERFGFVKQERGCCEFCLGTGIVCCLIGCPHYRIGAELMEKSLK